MKWKNLNAETQLSETLKADANPLYFFESDLFTPGIKLFPQQAKLMRKFYEGNYRELVGCIGMRAGKTKMGIFLMMYELFKLLRKKNPIEEFNLAPGQTIFLTGVSFNEKQALQEIKRPLTIMIRDSPFFRQFHIEDKYRQIRFPNKNIICAFGGSSTPGLLGKTAKCVLFDELAEFHSSGTFTGKHAYNKVSRSVRTFGSQGHIFVFSSPKHKHDFLMDLLRRYEEMEDILTVQMPTWKFNPRISREDLEDEFEKDYEAAMCDYGAQPVATIESYFKQNAIMKAQKCMNLKLSNDLEDLHNGGNPKVKPGGYVLAGDPALRHDAFGLALARDAGKKIVIEGMWKFDPEKGEINPVEVADFIGKICKTFPVNMCVFDTWHFPEMQEHLKNLNIEVENQIVQKDAYDLLKACIFNDEIEFCNYPFLIEELSNLKLKSRTKVDHAKHSSKDVADAVCNANRIIKSRNLIGEVPYNITVPR